MTYFLSLCELAVMICVVTVSLHVTMTDSTLTDIFNVTVAVSRVDVNKSTNATIIVSVVVSQVNYIRLTATLIN